jgi:hypothetical protein
VTDTAGPFDGTPWAEAQWARHAAAWAPSGVYGPPGSSTSTGDLPLSVSALNVGLGAGRAWVRGFGFERSGAAVMQAVAANTHASFSRRDRIVLRRNLATHTVAPVLIQGTPASTPVAPALTQSETGSWDLPMFSFLVPPSSGTSITGIVDERGWLSASGGLEVPSIAVRDAHFPSPSRGQGCTVSGNPHHYDGSGWRFWFAGAASGTTDASGLLVFPHNLGQAPAYTPTVGLASMLTEPLNQVGKVVFFGADATNITVKFYRTDTNAALTSQPGVVCTYVGRA